MLIATLPPIYREGLLAKIIESPTIEGVRYNTGMVSPFSPLETLRKLKVAADDAEKKLWIDLKGRQLRVIKWAYPDYGTIELNHNVSIEGTAYAIFRNGKPNEIKFASGNKIFLDSPPEHAVGEGQSLNILGDSVQIEGYLTETDREFVRAAAKLRHTDFMLSFVEEMEDAMQVTQEYTNALEGTACPPLELRLKIESFRGVEFAESEAEGGMMPSLVAARDDLYTTSGSGRAAVVSVLKSLVNFDPDAIVASRIFSGLERTGEVELSDFCDIELMRRFGYKHFMLSDEISERNFDKAIAAWNEYHKT